MIQIAAEPRPGRIFGYIRVSSDKQVESGLGLEAQKTAIFARRQTILEKNPTWEWVGIWADEAVSAYRRNLRTRPRGQQLDAVLREGDLVIVAKADRAFRSLKDGIATCEDWLQRGITIVAIDLPLDMLTPGGRLQSQIFMAFGEYESAMISARTREANAAKIAAGLPPGGQCGTGKRWAGTRGKMYWVDDVPMRAVMKEIYRLRQSGLSFLDVSLAIEQYIAEQENRKPRPEGWRRFHKVACWRLYQAECRYLSQEALDAIPLPDPPQSPPATPPVV